jgi:phosphopantothenoylcysteine decarboxylase/phosphopantothenate--cysteine ligase
MAERPLADRTILLGVTGSVAAYKAVDLASRLTRAGARVPVILTDAGRAFVQPLSFESITHQPVHGALFGPHPVEPHHISLAEAAELLLIAPATANCLAKLALGLADDLLSCVALATRAPILLAPAMNDGMFAHPATQGHLETLRQRGVRTVGPAAGRLASGKEGRGRLAPVGEIQAAATELLTEGTA